MFYKPVINRIIWMSTNNFLVEAFKNFNMLLIITHLFFSLLSLCSFVPIVSHVEPLDMVLLETC